MAHFLINWIDFLNSTRPLILTDDSPSTHLHMVMLPQRDLVALLDRFAGQSPVDDTLVIREKSMGEMEECLAQRDTPFPSGSACKWCASLLAIPIKVVVISYSGCPACSVFTGHARTVRV